MIWPEIFTSDNAREYAEGKSDRELCADGLCGWGICKSGLAGSIPESFGSVMVEIGRRLGVAPIAENLMKWADDEIAKEAGRDS